MSAAMIDSRVSRLITRRGPEDTGDTGDTEAEKSVSGLRAGSGVIVDTSFLGVADSFHSAMVRSPFLIGHEISVLQTRIWHVRYLFADSYPAVCSLEKFFRSYRLRKEILRGILS